MKIVLSRFVRVQFEGMNAPFLNVDIAEFQRQLNQRVPQLERPGYAPFCRLRFYRNWTTAKCGIVPLTPELYPYVETCYEARQEAELPVLERFLSSRYCNVPAPYLCLVLYDRAQMALEGELIEGDFAVVHILCLLEPEEPPIPPVAQMRNALGIAEGGSGTPLNRDQYLAAVAFWSKHIAVRPD